MIYANPTHPKRKFRMDSPRFSGGVSFLQKNLRLGSVKRKTNKKGNLKKMPLAGTNPEARAHAHYRWAQRYAEKGGRTHQAIAHFGRALEYTRFGAHDDRLKSYDEMIETYDHFYVGTADDNRAMFPISALDGDGDGDGDRAFYDKLSAEPGSRLIAGPLKIHVAPTLEVDVNVELQEGEQEHRAVRNGALVPVNILGNLLWKLHDGLAKPYERLPRDIVAGRYTSAALIRCGDALGDPFKKFSKNTPEIEAKEKADLYEMLRTGASASAGAECTRVAYTQAPCRSRIDLCRL